VHFYIANAIFFWDVVPQTCTGALPIDPLGYFRSQTTSVCGVHKKFLKLNYGTKITLTAETAGGVVTAANDREAK